MPFNRIDTEPERHTTLCMVPALFFLLFWFATSAFCGTPADKDNSRTEKSFGLRWFASLPERGAISFYKNFISNQDTPTCNFNPTCSSFSMHAYQSTDPVQATLIMFDRLTRCNYWIYGEYPLENGRFTDPVEQHILWGTGRIVHMHRHAGPTGNSPSPGIQTENIPTESSRYDIAFADAMAAEGEIDLALDEYAWLSGDSFPAPVRIQALFHCGWVLYESGAFPDAAAAFEKVQTLTVENSDESKDASLLQHLAASADMHGESSNEPSGNTLLSYIRAWRDLHSGDIAGARERLTSLANSSNKQVAVASGTMISVIDSLDNPLNKKKWIAGALSAVMPGAGRVYTGRYGDAVFSSIVTDGTAALAYRAIQSGPWTKAAFFSGSAAGFYAGNVFGSILSARTENARSREAIANTVHAHAEAGGILPRQIIARSLANRLPHSTIPDSSRYNEVLSAEARARADHYFSSGKWHKAVRSYRRYLFFTAEHGISDTAMFRLGKSLEYAGNTGKAAAVYDELLDRYPDSLHEEDTRLALARLHFRQGEYDLAGFELDEEIEYGRDHSLVDEAIYLKTWVFINESDFDRARSWLGDQDANQSESLMAARSKVAGSLTKQRDITYKSPRLARGLSMVVPGLGQAYAGKPLNGAGALLINGAIIYSMVHSAQSENWLDLGLITGLLFHRFYIGNINNAERFSREYNDSQNARLIRRLQDDVRTIGITFDPFILKEKHANAFP